MTDSYIGINAPNRISAAFQKEDFLGSDLSTITVSGVAHTNAVALTLEVPGGNTENIHVVLDNVVQEPDVAYTIHNDADGNPNGLSRLLRNCRAYEVAICGAGNYVRGW